MANPKLSREAIAGKEIGHTEIRNTMAGWLSLFFLILIFSVPLFQMLRDERLLPPFHLSFPQSSARSQVAPIFARVERVNTALLAAMDGFERNLEENSFLRSWCLPPLQYVLARFFGQGNEKVVLGRQDTLFYAPDVDYLLGPPFLSPAQLAARRADHKRWEAPMQPDPIAAIVDFHYQLQRRDIALIVLVVPVKPAIEPNALSHRELPSPLSNRSWRQFRHSLTEQGVQLLDIRQLLADYATAHGSSYLAGDTHWRPETMTLTAQLLAREIDRLFPGLAHTTSYQLQEQEVSGYGDIARMLVLPQGSTLFPPERIHVSQVLNEQHELWQPDKNSEILLLGDSFTNIYGVDGLGWGRGGGFAEQLSYQLQAPVDLLAENDNGAYATRQMLAAELGRGRDRLAGKKLVIWEFAARELAFGDWKMLPLALGESRETGFFTVPAGEKIAVRGVVAEISRSPLPGTVPYRDNIITLHLIDLTGVDTPLTDNQAVIYGWGMRDNKLTELAGIRPGDTIQLQLVPWDAVETEYGGYRRSPLDNEMMELEIPNWGTFVPQ